MHVVLIYPEMLGFLTIDGEVRSPSRLDPAELRRLADGELAADFHCVEGWSRLDQHWRGVRLATLLRAVGIDDGAAHVTVASGGFTVVLTRAEAEDKRVLLALELDGVPLQPPELPRLVGPPDWDCFRSVKGVDRIEATVEPAEATAAAIALARLPAEPARPDSRRALVP
jgi:DMSO/TMAO reductase YedYZ molybdopterin-dependent catalytic subunit